MANYSFSKKFYIKISNESNFDQSLPTVLVADEQTVLNTVRFFNLGPSAVNRSKGINKYRISYEMDVDETVNVNLDFTHGNKTHSAKVFIYKNDHMKMHNPETVFESDKFNPNFNVCSLLDFFMNKFLVYLNFILTCKHVKGTALHESALFREYLDHVPDNLISYHVMIYKKVCHAVVHCLYGEEFNDINEIKRRQLSLSTNLNSLSKEKCNELREHTEIKKLLSSINQLVGNEPLSTMPMEPWHYYNENHASIHHDYCSCNRYNSAGGVI